MQGQFNITINGNKYGVLVRSSKYANIYRKAKNPVNNETTNLYDELLYAFEKNPSLVNDFLTGKSIKL